MGTPLYGVQGPSGIPLANRSSPFKTLQSRRRGPQLHITLNRPRAANRVNAQMALELAELAETANRDDAVRVVVLSGRGSAFSSGWEAVRARASGQQGLLAAASIARIEKPVIAAINGDAVGQGLELALAADLRIAVRGARFGLPHLSRGAMPWDGGTQRLPRIVGRAKAMELLLTGEIIDAQEARRIGLVSRTVEPEELRELADRVAVQIAGAAPVAARYAKEAVTAGADIPLADGMRLEADLSILLHTTRDRAEGIRSFFERRQPRFRGR